MNDAHDLDRLSLSLHSAVPPLLTVCIAYTLVVDKAFVAFKVMGATCHSRLRWALARLYLVCNTLLNAGVCWLVTKNCDLWGDVLSPHRVAHLRFESHGACLPAIAAACLLSLLLMWIDRAAELFFSPAPRTHTSIFTRSSTATLVAGAFIATSRNDPSGVLLLMLFYTGRPLGRWPSDQARNFASGLRFAVRLYVLGSGLALLWDMRACEADTSCRATPKTVVLAVALSAAAS